jgi:hypothetical protein
MTTLSHINRLPVTIEYPYENINHIGGFPQSNLF